MSAVVDADRQSIDELTAEPSCDERDRDSDR
jgi:hypothetical protein